VGTVASWQRPAVSVAGTAADSDTSVPSPVSSAASRIASPNHLDRTHRRKDPPRIHEAQPSAASRTNPESELSADRTSAERRVAGVVGNVGRRIGKLQGSSVVSQVGGDLPSASVRDDLAVPSRHRCKHAGPGGAVEPTPDAGHRPPMASRCPAATAGVPTSKQSGLSSSYAGAGRGSAHGEMRL
jgi:hypothetical protein